MCQLSQNLRLTRNAPKTQDASSSNLPWNKILRFGLLALILGGGLLYAYLTGATQHWTPQAIQAQILAAGSLGILLFIASFAVGNLLQIPGIIFIAAAALTYGPYVSIPIALIGSVIAVSTSFGIVRTLGGTPAEGIQKPWMKKLLGKLEEHPIAIIAVLRIFVLASPPLNYALALSTVKTRDFLLGSTLGLLLPVIVVCVGIDSIVTMI